MWPEFAVELDEATLRWTSEYSDTYRLMVLSKSGSILALEGEQTGLFIHVGGQARRLAIPVDAEILEVGQAQANWQYCDEETGLVISGRCQRLAPEAALVVHRFGVSRALPSPHLSWGLRLVVNTPINHYHWVQSPTQMGYCFADYGLTLWLISTHEQGRPVGRLAGCQALIAQHPDPVSLEFHLRSPPGFTEPSTQEYGLEPGQVAELRCIVAVRPGFFHEHVQANEGLQPLESCPSRYPYRRYIQMAVEQFHDRRKYHAEGRGILYYTAVDGSPEKPRIQYWTEGPGWGGGFDAENAHTVLLHARQAPTEKLRDQYNCHARAMLDGWLDNPRFRVPPDVFYREPGDMKEAIISTGWFPDCIWTGAQADMILRLSDIYALTGWDDCLCVAREVGRWVQRHQDEDGSIPTLWQFPVEYREELLTDWRPRFSLCRRKDRHAEVLVGCQPATACFLVVGLLHLQQVDPRGGWEASAAELLAHVVNRLETPLAEFGNGELDYLVFGANSMDPTGLAYIIWGLAEAYRRWPQPLYLSLLSRYADTLLSFGVTYDFKETLLRPRAKVSLGEYGADIRVGGGVTHGNWSPTYGRGFRGRFHLLMNRNEIAEGLLQAWQVTGDDRYCRWLEAVANWQTWFQFTREVANSPVSTRGSCPQNHPWTTDWGNWNNDYAVTAHKWVGTYLRLIEAGLTGEGASPPGL